MSHNARDFPEEFASRDPSPFTSEVSYDNHDDDADDESNHSDVCSSLDSTFDDDAQPTELVFGPPSDQSASLLFTLPPELRVQIYGYCFNDRAYHIESEHHVFLTPTFNALRSVCRLIKHEFDPLYARANSEPIRHMILQCNDEHDWVASFVTLREMLEERCLAPNSYYTGYNSDGESVDREFDETNDTSGTPCRYCTGDDRINITVNLTVSPGDSGWEENELSSWYTVVERHASGYKVQYNVAFQHDSQESERYNHESGTKPCFGCMVKGYLQTVTDFGIADTLGGSRVTDAMA